MVLTIPVNSYLAELHKIAINYPSFGSTTTAKLKTAPVLIGFRRIKGQTSRRPAGDGEDQNLEHKLLAADAVAIVDDAIVLQYFGDTIFCAPQEDTLEGKQNQYVWNSILTHKAIAFYKCLGCKALSTFAQEEYLTSQETPGHQTAQEVRSQILQRLPLFPYIHTKPTTQVSRLNDEASFIIRTFEKITIIRRLSYAGTQSSKSIEVPVIARKGNRDVVELCLAKSTKVDMYEVATSLCHLLFDTHRVNDAFLFISVLSTDLHILQKRGFEGNQKLSSLAYSTLLTKFL